MDRYALVFKVFGYLVLFCGKDGFECRADNLCLASVGADEPLAARLQSPMFGDGIVCIESYL